MKRIKKILNKYRWDRIGVWTAILAGCFITLFYVGMLISSACIFLLTSCTNQPEETLYATVNVSFKASEMFNTRTSEVLLFDANGYFEDRYTDRISRDAVTLTAEKGAHYILVFINREAFTLVPQEYKKGVTHINDIAANAGKDDNPYLWFAHTKQVFQAGVTAIEIGLTKVSSVSFGLKVNPWTYRETVVEL